MGCDGCALFIDLKLTFPDVVSAAVGVGVEGIEKKRNG